VVLSVADHGSGPRQRGRRCQTAFVRRDLGDGYELDDDPARIDFESVYRYLAEESYWARGRVRETQAEMMRRAARLVGLYHTGRHVGFTRTAVVPGMRVAYLYDVFVLEGHRGRGLGEELVRETVDRGPYRDFRWLLDTDDAHPFYERFGFGRPSQRLMERLPP
jgi:GNAT superfamily N-acetyltransferase